MKKLLDKVLKIAIEAGEIVLNVYKKGACIASAKQDGSPVTIADELANNYITNSLQETSIPIVSEESEIASYKERSQWKQFWLVDPLDGTKEFLNRNGEFTVNIALIDKGMPCLGVVYAPVLGKLYYGGVALGAYRGEVEKGKIKNEEKIPLKELTPDKEIVVVASRSHKDKQTNHFIEQLTGNVRVLSIGSSLKLCMIATGEAMYYPRFVHLKEWDIAAGVALVQAAGGQVTAANGDALSFNSKSLNSDFFVAKSYGAVQK